LMNPIGTKKKSERANNFTNPHTYSRTARASNRRHV
jgi:hypothetical protein